MHRLAIFITDFGDAGVTVPLAAVTMAILFARRCPALALGWGVCIAGCAGAILVLKLLLLGAASPSGHAAMSTAVYGGFAALLGGSRAPLGRHAATLGAIALVLAIAGSRVILHEHSVAEVVIGLIVGVAGLVAFCGVPAAAPAERLPVIRLCVAALVTVAVMHGTRWPTEGMIHRMAGLASLHG